MLRESSREFGADPGCAWKWSGGGRGLISCGDCGGREARAVKDDEEEGGGGSGPRRAGGEWRNVTGGHWMSVVVVDGDEETTDVNGRPLKMESPPIVTSEVKLFGTWGGNVGASN